MRIQKTSILLTCLVGAVCVTGCTTKLGGVVPKSAFTYPNSNMTPLGPVKATKSKTAFFISPRWSFEDVKGVYNDALSKAPGANVIVDYKEDTSFTSIMMINTISYTLEGTAVKMDIGKKNMQ